MPPLNTTPPAEKDWGLILSQWNIYTFPIGWGNIDYLESNKNEGAVRAVLPTPDGGGIWMQGGYGWQFWRLFPDGTLHRYTRQPDGSLREFRVETISGNVVYTQIHPFGGGTAGDTAWAARPQRSPFHVTSSNGMTWYYDDAGLVSFGVARDGSVAVFDLNLTPDGPVPADGTFVLKNSRGWGVSRWPAYLGAPYGGQVLPTQPFSDSAIGDFPGYLQRTVPYSVSASYFKNLSLSDEKILSMSAAALASIYYTILSPKMVGNCPHYVPNDTVSASMSEAQAYCNEMDIRLRIYTLRPDMHFVLNAAGQKVIGLVDPLKIPIYNGLRCKESMIATIGLSVAIGLVTMGAGAILPILGTLADLAQFGASVSDLFAAQEGMQKMIDFQTQVKTGAAGLLQQTSPTNPTPPPAPAPPAPVRSPVPTVGVVAAVPAPVGGNHPAGPVPATASHNSLAFWVVALLFLL